jgi:hypothetical protein
MTIFLDSLFLTFRLSFIERVESDTEPVAPVVPRHPKSYMEVSYLSNIGIKLLPF